MKFSHQFCIFPKYKMLHHLGISSLVPFHNTESPINCSGFYDMFGILFTHYATTLKVKKITASNSLGKMSTLVFTTDFTWLLTQ